MNHFLRHTAKAAIATVLALAPAWASAKDYTEGANTYIISEAGTHSFLPVHVDGTAINIVKADWIWAEKDPTEIAQDMISNVRLEDGRVTFDYSASREGNALIAGFDDTGVIVWTWLIWFTDQPTDVQLDNGKYFQDRLLGAVGASQDAVTEHKHPEAWSPIGYQWGRAVPIFNGYNNETTAMTEPKRYTQINPEYASVYTWTANLNQTVDIATSFANPTTWYTDVNDNDNWYTTADNTLWSANEKTNYDPSPEGYKVPSQTDFGNFGTKAELANIYGYTYTNTQGETSWWRGCGSGRYFGDAKYDAVSSAGSTPIYYFLSDQYTGWGTPYPKRLLLQTDPAADRLTPFSGGLRCASYNIRCVRYKGDAITAIRNIETPNSLSIRATAGNVAASFAAGQYSALTLVDAAGRTLETVSVAPTDTQAAFTLPQTTHGVYIVKATNGQHSTAQKFVVR